MANCSSFPDDLHKSSHGIAVHSLSGATVLECGPGHSTKQFFLDIFRKFGPQAELQFVSQTGDQLGLIIYRLLRWPQSISNIPLPEGDITVAIMANTRRGIRRVSFGNGEVDDRFFRHKRMTRKQNPAFLHVPWYILHELTEDEEDMNDLPKQWGFPMLDDYLTVQCCYKCKAVTTQLGAYLNDWKQEDDDSEEESTPAATEWTCPRCYGEDLEFHCAQCDIPLFAESHAIQDTNCRPQYADDEDEALMWCSDCSVRISGNFCGG